MLAELTAPDPFGRLLFVNHLPCWQLNFEYERELQAVAAARRIEEFLVHRPAHVILVGCAGIHAVAIAQITLLPGCCIIHSTRASEDGSSNRSTTRCACASTRIVP